MRRYGLIILLCLAMMPSLLMAGGKGFDKYPKFQFGPTGMFITISGGTKVEVVSVQAKTPADGQIQVGDVITELYGKPIKGPDPRVMLGNAINTAEGTRGKLALTVRRKGAVRKVVVKLPGIGSYSKTWPVKCAKSKTIIDQTARYLAANQSPNGTFILGGRASQGTIGCCMSGLFLLSTGDDAYLPNVRRLARALAARGEKHPPGSMWVLGYQMVLIGEYYLRTGDRAVLPALKAMSDQAARSQYVGGWSHGAGINPGYVQGGLMNSAGVTVLAGMVLARECGVDVPPVALKKGLELMYRMAGHGSVPYGDHRAEMYAHTNGRNMVTACTFSLLAGKQYQMASAMLGAMVPDSYYLPEAGHTGGGLGAMWRGVGSIHAPKARKGSYRRQMDILAWYYDLCRMPGGGFSMPPCPPNNGRYSGLTWGTGGIGMAYTAPLRTLRITGRKPTRYSVLKPLPPVKWGNDADVVFLKTEHCDGFGQEKLPPHVVYNLLSTHKAETALAAKMLRHFNPVIRNWAGEVLARRADKASVDALVEAAGHSDPRVRHAALTAVGNYNSFRRGRSNGRIPSGVVSARFGKIIAKILGDPKSAWWEIDGALWALRMAGPATVRANMPAIVKYSRHEERWLREATLIAMSGLGRDIGDNEIIMIARMYAKEKHVFFRGTFYSIYNQLVPRMKVKLSPAARAKTIAILGRTLHTMKTIKEYGIGGKHEAAHRTAMILSKGFGNKDYKLIRGDIIKYLRTWKPKMQHSDWMITGNGWQPGIIKIAKDLGPDGRAIRAALQKCYDTHFGDPKKLKNNHSRKALEAAGYGKKK
ncbi:MAG: hypothetical protein GY794_08900 [bacterium]|nr:hypothetical protein [bacterium]